ncbi:glucose-6-phosphate isomerase [Sandaracinobacteroides hominis]|uniref:glucose-6-phosphate isomerase n=1 Tax=Sandaracinobacteroides hominis TaxID=2780086 RepID=UPI0018F4B686|nr:glucose-6-phosphate isomerase [Sandaracinobacteroides hominis]
MLPHQTTAWSLLRKLAQAPQLPVLELFHEEPDRLTTMSPKVDGIVFDFSKLPVSGMQMQALAGLAIEADLSAWWRKLAAGEVVNQSEQRAATHMQLRDPKLRAEQAPLLEMARKVRAGELGPVRHLIHIGIGGSALGPHLLVDALGTRSDGPEVHVAANIDGAALARAFAAADPAETLLIAVSKTFTTQETLTNLKSALDWLQANDVPDPISRVIAVTAAPEKARAAGIEHILPFAESVGGRYSLWSAVGLPLAIRSGPDAFEALLDGAHAMDRHFLSTPLLANAPVLAAMIDVWQAAFLGKPTRGIFAYDERLRLLPPYLQQLEMESNGKSVARDGTPLPFPTAAISWGGTGTDAQHAVFQLLHQGTHTDPIEFVAVGKPEHSLDPIHHKLLLANCFAQGAALLRGRTAKEALAEAKGDAALASAKGFPGNRGSATILLDELTPARLGALLAFYEARTFSAAVLMGVNPFDQWGVELGKQVANKLAAGETAGFDPSTEALMQAAGLQDVNP